MANKLLREAFFKNLIKSKTSDTSSEEVAFESEDPIEVYNHTIKQFNAKCNKATEGIYETISNNWLYRQ